MRKSIDVIAKDLFNDVSEKDILRYVRGKFYFNGKVLTEAQQKDIILQAQALLKSDLFLLLMREMVYEGNKKIYHDSKDLQDLLAGKMVLWTVDVLKKKVENIAKLDA